MRQVCFEVEQKRSRQTGLETACVAYVCSAGVPDEHIRKMQNMHVLTGQVHAFA